MIPRSTLLAEQRSLVRTFGRRAREARELCGTAQHAAATLLGYENPSKLSKVENALDTNSVPLWLIPRVSNLYDVSTDWLFGLSDDWERDPMARDATAATRWLHEQTTTHVARQIAETRRLVDRVSIVQTATEGLSTAVDDLLNSVLRFWELNGEQFEEMPGGATVVAALERAEAASRDARGRLWRLRKEVFK